MRFSCGVFASGVQSAEETGRLRGWRFLEEKALFYGVLRGRGRCVERSGTVRFTVIDGGETGYGENGAF